MEKKFIFFFDILKKIKMDVIIFGFIQLVVILEKTFARFFFNFMFSALQIFLLHLFGIKNLFFIQLNYIVHTYFPLAKDVCFVELKQTWWTI